MKLLLSIVSLLAILLCKPAYAQVDLYNTGILYSSNSSDILYINGNFTNTSSAALTNSGSLYVRLDLSNSQASMAVGTGTLYLNGTTAQSVNGTQTFKTYHLNTNNSSGITLNNNLSISGTHTFTNGVITTSSTPNYMIYEAGSSYTGDGDSRHINGWVKKFGSANFIFPVGNGTVERTIALNSLSAGSEFNAKYFANTPFIDQTQSPYWDIDDVEYWSIQKTSGGSATVTMNWDKSKVYFPNYIIPDIFTAGYNGSLWIDNGGTATGNVATTGTITSSSISSFNLFTFGSRSYILPVTLISFNATRPGNYTQISWTTEKEYNAGHFVVERSDDGLSFYAITQLPARNSGITEQYNTRDNAVVYRTAYYRLRSVDANGHENISRTVAVTVSPGIRLTLLANPVHDRVMLMANQALNGLFNYTITAINGQLTQQGKLLIQNGGSYQIPFNKFITPGPYLLEVRNGPEKFNFKLVVQ